MECSFYETKDTNNVFMSIWPSRNSWGCIPGFIAIQLQQKNVFEITLSHSSRTIHSSVSWLKTTGRQNDSYYSTPVKFRNVLLFAQMWKMREISSIPTHFYKSCTALHYQQTWRTYEYLHTPLRLSLWQKRQSSNFLATV